MAANVTKSIFKLSIKVEENFSLCAFKAYHGHSYLFILVIGSLIHDVTGRLLLQKLSLQFPSYYYFVLIQNTCSENDTERTTLAH